MGRKTILTSGFGLGFYIPALLLEYQLSERQVPAEAVVFENFIVKEKKDKIAESRHDYHINFAVARVAQKFPMDIRDSIDFAAVDQLLAAWERERRRDFIVFSGHWIYILDMYGERVGSESLNVDLLYVDTDLSPSWKSVKKYVPDYAERYREVWLFDAANGQIRCRVPAADEPAVTYAGRPQRLAVHGGGWGMGTYLEKINELERHYELDIVIASEADCDVSNTRHRYWMNDPSWEAWEKGPETGKHTFPRFGEIKAGESPVFATQESHHRLYDLIKGAKAIVSKPGGATLLDSLSSATPVVFLEPFGPHEQRNADLWTQLGFGIPYEQWKLADFSPELLEPLHEALLAHRKAAPSYADLLFDNSIMR
ncbi:UDP-glucuronosyltransferase [Paenibacillus andongensis]|uniref:UDP-glucuronosyltransferase n=1 Tax=Paenibacillus andongensis TaxID=2975482 RepID=UPI0021BAD70F|nr:UDP-glucuronosyltransferase [Paenibacillus andongensis]